MATCVASHIALVATGGSWSDPKALPAIACHRSNFSQPPVNLGLSPFGGGGGASSPKEKRESFSLIGRLGFSPSASPLSPGGGLSPFGGGGLSSFSPLSISVMQSASEYLYNFIAHSYATTTDVASAANVAIFIFNGFNILFGQ